ncbi:hypothetical protein LTR78_009657 [Recurvomyces mirabilis]|uniref:Uncharacterized protein n=1 Tax=Recurvomyces mirabilis TaxID=574656 RepID=A0AAE0WHA0_9PEZI|nr:hypothetical protein LTR78_009657 [Recurvomyces mirabilis]KAK5150300.1 hypothetical protein LTS14_010277 [Recurvomyces mirabilis]
MQQSSRLLAVTIFYLLATTIISQTTALSPPTCQGLAPPQTNLTSVRTAFTSVPGTPWGLSFAGPSHPNRAFVTLTGLSVNGSVQYGNGTLGVLDTTSFPPKLLHQIPLPVSFQPPGVAAAASAGIAQLSVSPDRKRVLIAAGPGGIVVDARRALTGAADAVLGTLKGTTGDMSPGTNAIAVAVSLDEKYAMVSQEHGNGSALDNAMSTPGNLDVFRLDADPRKHNGTGGYLIGQLNLGYNVAGATIAPDGKHLYVTSERYTSAGARLNTSVPCSALLPGFFSVVDLHQLEHHPAKARHIDIPAGFAPNRFRPSPHGKTVWLTARESNALLAYNASALHSNDTTADALLAVIQVGNAPVDLIFVKNGTRIVTADSNRFGYAGALAGLTVVEVEAGLSGSGGNTTAVLGRVPTGFFPRDLAVSEDGRWVLGSVYNSGKVQYTDVETLP